MSESVSPRVWRAPDGRLIREVEKRASLAVYDKHRAGYAAWIDTLPTDAVELVPVSRVEALEAELAEAKSELVEALGMTATNPATAETWTWGEVISKAKILRSGAKQLGEVIDRQGRDVLDITGLHDLVDADGDGDWGLIWDKLREMVARGRSGKAAPSLPTPDAEDPEHLRWHTAMSHELWKISPIPHWDIKQITRRAEALEASAAEKAAHDQLIEQVAETMYADDCPEGNRCRPAWVDVNDVGREPYYSNARALVARFDITPKAEA